MFDQTHQPEAYRPRPHARSVTGSLLLAAAVPAALWAISYPLMTALFAVVAAILAVGVRALRARVADRSATGRPPVTPVDGS